MTLAELLRDHGYRTGGFSDNPFISRYFNYHRGFDEFVDYSHWMNQGGSLSNLNAVNRFLRQRIGPSIPEGHIYNLLKWGYDSLVKLVESKGKNVNSNDEAVVNRALEWIRTRNDAEEPYFAWIHLMDAHHPYGYFPEFRESLGVPADAGHVRMPSVEAGKEPPQSLIDAYDANLRSADANVGRLLDAVNEGTTVMLSADHGEEFGRHNRFHKESVYQSMAHVPLIVDGQRFDSGWNDARVSLIDLPATIANISIDRVPDRWDGRDLRERRVDDVVYLGFENNEGISGAVIRDCWKYIRRQESLTASPDHESLFDIIDDPHECDDRLPSEPAIHRELATLWDEFTEGVRRKRYTAERGVWDSSQNLSNTVNDSVPKQNIQDADKIDQRLENLGYK